jgi:hypothetical protein
LTTTTIAAAAHSTTPSTAAMAVIVECGGGRWLRWKWCLCRHVNDEDRCRRLHPTAASVNNDRCGRRSPSPPPTSTTMFAIAAVNDNDRRLE